MDTIASAQLDELPYYNSFFNCTAVFCRNTAIANGLMVRQVEDAIISAPPLIISHEEIDALVERLGLALEATARAYGVRTG